MKKLLYIFAFLLLLCSSCKTKQTVQEYTLHSDSTKTEYRAKKEIVKEKSSASSQITFTDTMSTSIIEEEFTIKFNTEGRPTVFHGKKKKSLLLSKSEENCSKEQHFTADKLSCDSDYVFANIEHSQYKKIVQPKKKSSRKNILFAVMLSLLTLIICHCVLKQKIKRKKLGA